MTYTVQQFTESLGADRPSAHLDAPLAGLWWDAKGDWDRAHKCVDHLNDRAGKRVHAYLHRKEGDLANAAYWYGQVGHHGRLMVARHVSARPAAEQHRKRSKHPELHGSGKRAEGTPNHVR